ncbi:phospholipase A-2-activating protein, partial [Strigomonas culicis]
MKIAPYPYVLQADAPLHTADVRHVCGVSDVQVLTASRDNTAVLAHVPPGGSADTAAAEKTFIGHTAFVNFALLHPSLALVGGAPCVVTGANDNHVAVWNCETATVEAVLDGHGAGVCCGALVQGWRRGATATEMDWEGDFVTGDWAGMLIVFDHVTGAKADLRAAQDGRARRGPPAGHGLGCVRLGRQNGTPVEPRERRDRAGLRGAPRRRAVLLRREQHALLHRQQRLPAAAVARRPSRPGARAARPRLTRLHGALQPLLGRAAVRVGGPHGEGLAQRRRAGAPPAEDFAVVQSIEHPCVVWSVAALPGTETLVSGGADGMVRVWTRDEGRAATSAKRQQLADAVAAQAVDIKVAAGAGGSVGGLDVASMPFVEEIHERVGATEGERLFARNEAGEVELYVWGGGKWSKVGVVVAGPAQQPYAGQQLTREKQYYNGKAYDYLFDVDIEGRSFKLPYNAGDSVIATAQNFMVDHAGAVAGDSLEEIVQFIMQNIRPEDIAKVPGLGGETRAPAAPSAAAPAPAADGTPAAPWGAPEELLAFNADGAQKKINDLTHNDGSFAGVVREVEAATEAPLLAAQLLSLYETLPPGSRFPALDMVRYLLLSPRRPLGCRVELLHGVLPA